MKDFHQIKKVCTEKDKRVSQHTARLNLEGEYHIPILEMNVVEFVSQSQVALEKVAEELFRSGSSTEVVEVGNKQLLQNSSFFEVGKVAESYYDLEFHCEKVKPQIVLFQATGYISDDFGEIISRLLYSSNCALVFLTIGEEQRFIQEISVRFSTLGFLADMVEGFQFQGKKYQLLSRLKRFIEYNILV